jgi:energy-coupling factor transporter ATP-binding protein EcfA2
MHFLFLWRNGKINLDILKLALKTHLQHVEEQENRRRTSMAGPHLDDLNMYLNDRPARQYASQGQQRNIAVSLKLAELMALQRSRGEYPVFLLDEVLSELDQERQDRLMSYLEGAEFQSFLTTVNLEDHLLNRIMLLINRVSSDTTLRKGVIQCIYTWVTITLFRPKTSWRYLTWNHQCARIFRTFWKSPALKKT